MKSVALLLCLLPALSWADASHCYSIQNHDRKNYCLANVKSDKSQCYSIQDQDTKNMCLAEVGNNKSQCY